MKKGVIIVGLLITIAVMSSFLNFFFGSSFSPKRKLAYKIIENFSKKMKAKHGLQYSGVFEAAPNGTYDKIGILFNYPYILTKDQGRALLLNCAEEALVAFNAAPEFEQYMTNSIFSTKNIQITIFVRSPELGDIYYPDIAVFSFVNNTLCYDTNSPEKKSWYYTEEEESYEEAKQIIAKQQSKVIGN